MFVLKWLYSEDLVVMKKVLKIYFGFMNIMLVMLYLIVGVDMVLEEEVGIEDEMVIIGLKIGLMGLFVGVGDIIFIVIYCVIVFLIVVYMV